MIDPNFNDPEKLHRLHAQKLEAMKTLMNEIRALFSCIMAI